MNDSRTSLERIEDLAFDEQVKRLTKNRQWRVLELAFAMHGLTLQAREKSDA